MEEIDHIIGALPAVSLQELDERAALLRRTDTKYVLDESAFRELLNTLAPDYDVLEIDGRRRFAYRSVYFDTPDLRCFRDHVEDRLPRFKARTRTYEDTGHCVFEIKLKVGHGETDKRQIDHALDQADQLDERATACLQQALADIELEPPERPLEASLRTSFTRITLAARNRSERVTCDLSIHLERPGDGTARLRDGLVVVESKSEHGDSPADQALTRQGVEPVSLSKYRTGIALLADNADDPESTREAKRFFTPERQAAATAASS
jgi:hypothetical protein